MPRRKRPVRPVLYFIGQEDQPKLVKVGHTRVRLSKRLGQMQSGNPFKLFVVGWLPTADPVGLEISAHERLRFLHMRGEWFRVDGCLQKVLDLAAPTGELPGWIVRNWLADPPTTVCDGSLPKPSGWPPKTPVRHEPLGPLASVTELDVYPGTSQHAGFLQATVITEKNIIFCEGDLPERVSVPAGWVRAGVLARINYNLMFHLVVPDERQVSIRSGPFFLRGPCRVSFQAEINAEQLYKQFAKSTSLPSLRLDTGDDYDEDDYDDGYDDEYEERIVPGVFDAWEEEYHEWLKKL